MILLAVALALTALLLLRAVHRRLRRPGGRARRVAPTKIDEVTRQPSASPLPPRTPILGLVAVAVIAFVAGMAVMLAFTGDAHRGEDLRAVAAFSAPTERGAEPSLSGEDQADPHCVKGKPCGDTCIAMGDTCRENKKAHRNKEGHGDGSVHVRGYYRKDGTYVHPHTRRAPHHHRRESSGGKGPSPNTGDS